MPNRDPAALHQVKPPMAAAVLRSLGNCVRASRRNELFASLYGAFNHIETFSGRKSMACQAESERYLNVVPVVHGGGGGKYPPSG